MTSTAKTAIVTGASNGIGAAVAERLVRDGLAVVIDYAGSQKPAEELAARLNAAGGRAIAVKADVADPGAVATLFDEAARAFGGVDVLVNNAGIMKLSPIGEADDALFDRHVAVNLKGVFNCMREGARRLREGGAIVSFSSSVVGLYQPTYGVYAATKAAVEAMTHVLAKELGGKKIRVNAIAPGPTATRLFLDDKSEQQVQQITKVIPLGRLAEPEDIAAAVSFLVGPDGRWINGQVLRANGGVV